LAQLENFDRRGAVKRALVIGIDDYPACPLSGCVNDAEDVARNLEVNGDGSPNFSVRLITSDRTHVSSQLMDDATSELFAAEADTALLFFAGHGVLNPETNAGFLVSQDGKQPHWGLSLAEIIERANAAHPKIRSTVIILDSCQSGYAGETSGLGKTPVSTIGTGVTILTACNKHGVAQEEGGRGLFTSLLTDGLSGSAADVCGRITPAGLYSLIDQTLGPWEQRPVYKANVQSFVTLRQVTPKIALEVLRRLPVYFPDAASDFPLNPSYEPDRSNMSEEAKLLYPEDKNKQRVFAELQACNRHGLVSPVNAEHMYFAAMNSTSCKLTALGAHYRRLALLQRL
jgi:hypothetical protein